MLSLYIGLFVVAMVLAPALILRPPRSTGGRVVAVVLGLPFAGFAVLLIAAFVTTDFTAKMLLFVATAVLVVLFVLVAEPLRERLHDACR